jgi:hypothetical protein
MKCIKYSVIAVANSVFVMWVFILYKGMNIEMKIFLVQELQCGSYQVKGI